MMHQDKKPESASPPGSVFNLRQKAEEQLLSTQLNPSTSQPFNPSTLQHLNAPTPPLSETDTLKLIHELQIHQIELEMQNEELRLALEQGGIANDKLKVIAETYSELYDFGLLGFFTLSRTGTITELNLSGAEMLGKGLAALKNSHFEYFVSNHDKPVFNRFLDKVFSSKIKENCELQLVTDKGILSYVYLSGIAGESEKECLLSAFDISKSKLAEERIRQSAMISLILNSIPDLVFYKETAGVYLGCNPPFAEFVGKSINDIVGKTDFDLFDKEVAEFFRYHDIEMLKQKRPRHNEEWATWPDGRKALLDTFKAPYCDANGTVIGILGVSRDITEHQQAEIRIRESELRFANLAEHSRVITWEVDAAGLYTFISPAVTNILEYRPDEIVGKKHFYDLHPEEQRESFKKAALEVFERKETFINLENRVLSRDGRIFWVSTNGIPIIDSTGSLTGYSGSDTDITERKNREFQIQLKNEELQKLNANLEQASARLTLATLAGGVGVWEYDIVKNILVWDNQMLELYGIDRKNFKGAYESWRAGLHPDDLKRGDAEIQLAIRGEKEFNTEFRVLWPDGEIRYIRALAIVQRDGTGKPLNMIGTNWDITAQKNAEEAIQKSEESLIKLNAEKDKFFSIIAHDLRSPFNGFLGLTELMAEPLSTFSKEETHDILVSLKNSAANLFSLLENLLQWSRMQQGLIPFHPETVQLLPLVMASLSTLQEPAKRKEIEIAYDIPAELTISAEINMLMSVLRNLTSNALKFTPRGGKIKVSARTSGNTIEISIKDTGIGMGPEIVKDLFRIDARISRAGTEGEPSSGLGLLLCKDFIEKHNGKIRAESEKGKGSVFHFTIPCTCQSVKQHIKSDPIKEQAGKQQHQKLKILIVEDDLVSEKFIAIAIKILSRDVLKVKTGVEAVKVCRENPDIDLVLMDIALPLIDGYEATRQIRQFNPEVVIIAQTANTRPKERQLALLAGCNDFIAKPLNKYLLRELIYKHFTGL